MTTRCIANLHSVLFCHVARSVARVGKRAVNSFTGHADIMCLGCTGSKGPPYWAFFKSFIYTYTSLGLSLTTLYHSYFHQSVFGFRADGLS